jgi:hypothetical protein
MTNQGLSNSTILRPILSGLKVPLGHPVHIEQKYRKEEDEAGPQ